MKKAIKKSKMQFVFIKRPAVQIKLTSTGDLTRSQILVLAFLKSRAKQGRVETTYSEIRQSLNISPLTIYESINTLIMARVIAKLI